MRLGVCLHLHVPARFGQRRERLLHAVLPRAEDAVEHVLLDVVLGVGDVEYLLVPFRHVVLDAYRPFVAEPPLPHREVLQHLQPRADSPLDTHHAVQGQDEPRERLPLNWVTCYFRRNLVSTFLGRFFAR